MWEITQTDVKTFEVRYGDVIVDTRTTYEAALERFVGEVSSALGALAAAGVGPTGGGDGVLPERWMAVDGICFSEDTGDGRDFTGCSWSSRDPNVSTLPLMLQVVNDYGHMSARWAGYIDEIKPGKTSTAAGRFYANDDGIRARDMMLSRQVGVSVDPGAVDAEFSCTEVDEWDWCIDGVTNFLAYEIIGLTITPFPAFAAAAIMLDAKSMAAGGAVLSIPAAAFVDQLVDAMGKPVRRPGPADHLDFMRDVLTAAAIDIPEIIPAEWFAMPEPEMGDPLLVRQPPQFKGDETERWAVPLTVTDDGRVFGHCAPSGVCHVGYRNECVTAPTSRTGYAFFHLGVTRTTDGDLATGVLSAACDHYPTDAPRRPGMANRHYENTALQWADARATDGKFGAWVCGALRPDVTAAQLRVVKACGLSGDWEDRGGNLEMIAAQCVSVPGFPITREWMAASGLAVPVWTGPTVRHAGGRVMALSAAGVVRRPCPDCAARAATQRALRSGVMDPREFMKALGLRFDRIEQVLARLDQRTAPLRATAAEKLRARISAGVD